MRRKVSIERIVEYEIDKISDDEEVIVKMKDLVYIYKSIIEFRRFFHNPMHIQEKKDLEKFIGNKKKGAFYLTDIIYTKIFDRIFNEDKRYEIEESFPNELIPDYY